MPQKMYIVRLSAQEREVCRQTVPQAQREQHAERVRPDRLVLIDAKTGPRYVLMHEAPRQLLGEIRQQLPGRECSPPRSELATGRLRLCNDSAQPEVCQMRVSFQEAVSVFGREAKSKLSNPVASGAPEDQLRAPLEALIPDLAELAGLHPGTVVMVGETSLADIKTRPDYAVTRGDAPERLHRDQGARQGRRPSTLPRPARPGAVDEAPDPSQSHLHRRQRVQPYGETARSKAMSFG